MLRRIIAVAVVSAFLTLPAANVSAQSTPENNNNNAIRGNGLRVSPVRSSLVVKPGGTATVDVYVENVTDNPAELRAAINDFTSGDDESGQPRLLLAEKTYSPSHGLKRYMVAIPDFTLKPKEQKIIKATVNIPSNAAGGGYYGAVRFVPKGTDPNTNVSLSASVGSLLLVTVPGDVKEQVDIVGFNTGKAGGKASTFYTSGDGLQATVRFKNSGNSHMDPFGKVVLKKGDAIVGTYEINNTDPRGSILPDSIRRFSVDFGDKAKGFGKYTAEGNFGYGSTGQLLSAKTTFYVVPWVYIIGLLVVIALIVGAVFKWRSGRQSKVSRRKR